METFLLGVIIGLVLGFIIGAKITDKDVTMITNEIGKIKTKGNDSPVNADQKQEPTIQKDKKPFFKRIFKSKKNEPKSN